MSVKEYETASSKASRNMIRSLQIRQPSLPLPNIVLSMSTTTSFGSTEKPKDSTALLICFGGMLGVTCMRLHLVKLFCLKTSIRDISAPWSCNLCLSAKQLRFLPTCHSLNLCQQITELAVVHLHPIIQIQGDALVCIVTEFLIEAAELFKLFNELVLLLLQFLLLSTGAGAVDVFCQLVDAALHAALQGNDVFHAHTGQGALVVAVQINQAFEGLLFAAGEQPVNWALFVGLQMILKEAGRQVATDGVVGSFAGLAAKAIGQPFHILNQGVLAPDNLYK